MANGLEETREYLDARRRAYQQCFSVVSPAATIVLEDFARFCRANETCVVPGSREVSLMLEGRREVWLRIMQHTQLSLEQQFALFSGNYQKLRSAK